MDSKRTVGEACRPITDAFVKMHAQVIRTWYDVKWFLTVRKKIYCRDRQISPETQAIFAHYCPRDTRIPRTLGDKNAAVIRDRTSG